VGGLLNSISLPYYWQSVNGFLNAERRYIINMMDTFCEQLVYKYPSGKDNFKKFVTYAVAIVLAVTVIFLTMGTVFAGIGILLGAGLGWLGYFLGSRQYVEYEYIITNGEIDVDKIVGKSKRSRLLTVKVSSFTAYAEYSDSVPDNDELTLFLATENTGVDDWYADFESDTYGKCRLIFTPNAEFRECITPYLKNGIRLQKR
jgi:hypothetical protein